MSLPRGYTRPRSADRIACRRGQGRPARVRHLSRNIFAALLLVTLTAALFPFPAFAQTAPADDAAGRPVVEVRVVGNRTIADNEILNAVRTKPGEAFDPQTVRDDYGRIYDMRRFSRVEARYETTPAGVIVVFDVEEQSQVGAVRFRGNVAVSDVALRRLVSLEAGRSLDPILLAFAQSAIEEHYRGRNFALVQVRVAREAESGVVTFDIVEGPRVRVKNINFVGADAFPESRLLASKLRRQIGTRIYWPAGLLGRNGRLDERQLDEDVASLQRFYRDQGYFDARVGRKVIFSPDQTEAQVDFLIEEGPRYTINSIRFEGNERLTDEQLQEASRLEPGRPFEADAVRRAQARMVEAYSPFGLIYAQPGLLAQREPDYLTIEESVVFELEPGKVDLVFNISEGKPFRVGKIEVRGNSRTQDKVILRQFDLAPGDVYDSADVQRATRRLLASRYYSRVNVTPVGSDPESRDLLVEVEETSTAIFTVGGAVSSNGGLIGTIKYEQTNFDIADLPERPGDVLGGHAFVGGGQSLRILLEPGTLRSNASIAFFEPFLLDQNLGFGTEAYYRTYRRREFQEGRTGGRIRFVPRIGRDFSTTISLRGEDVRIFDLDDPRAERAPEYLEYDGNTTLTSVGLDLGYSRVDDRRLPTRGFSVGAGWESFGLLGGDPNFQRLTTSFTGYVPLYRNITDQPVVAEFRIDGGYLYNDAPFFERFYGGGYGSLRGFRFRGVSPRGGPVGDTVGGDFSVTGSLGVGFPLYGESIRGVVFSDFGTVESDLELGTIRSSLGFGFRFTFEGLGNVPIALDFAWPLNRRPEDDLQVFSFSLGILQ